MISNVIQSAINDQIQEEIASSHLYLSMAAFCHGQNLHGFAHWMKLQSEEEMGHAMKLYDYLIERGGRVELQGVKKPPRDFKSIAHMVSMTLKNEERVTRLVNALYEKATKLKDYATQVMLHWFITEQVEEEASVTEILEKLKLISDKSSAILYLDKEVGKRGKQASS